MKSAFNQIPLHFADRYKTAFSAPDGDKYEFNRLCFGLKNSPKAFQSIAQEAVFEVRQITPKIHAWLLVDSLSCPLLRFSIGAETNAELQHSKMYGFSELFGSAGNPLTHPTIYESSDPQEKKRKHINYFQSLNDVIHWSPSTINVPSGEKRKHINSLQSLNDAIHWSPSTVREFGHPVASTSGEEVADA
ncbi:hypothetical protein TNCV_4529241 [Trichonephila clavipes]|uniref:Reverse transcriptase domain-containing protein n=1 Tax=Trichonephila clavipes TaxID=2585209 RepID=A0A8X6VCB0_TRICX|nr:hypothetical protein TNCV_4529241 [Trichonephila clavipes]